LRFHSLFLEIGVRFGFSFLPTMLASDKLEYALGWDLETYGDNNIANGAVTNAKLAEPNAFEDYFLLGSL
jgi:hypothetical protein